VGLAVPVVDAVVQQCAQHERERVDFRDLVLLNAARHLSRTAKCYYISVLYYSVLLHSSIAIWYY
jgi:hypothetical protein